MKLVIATTHPGKLREIEGLRSGIPVTYIRTGRDQTLPPEQQDAAIAAVGTPEVIDIDSGHMVMISQPELLGATLNDIRALHDG